VDVEAWSSVGKIDDSPPNILVVGRLEPRKAPEVVLSAAELLAPDVRDLRVTFVGRSNGVREGKPYGDWVADLAQRFGIPARFVGQITHDRMSDMYSEARVVAVPSHFDSFSVAALEAMAAGRPVVYTSSVGAAEVLRGSGGGTEVPTNDATAMADALRPYLVDTQHAADGGRAARNIARARCSPDIIAEQRERCFEDAVDGGRREA
jgi:glycosyltransferase involved in cell wall biosynthesis